MSAVPSRFPARPAERGRSWRRWLALAALACLFSPLAAMGGACGCAPEGCPVHHAGSAAAPRPVCHETAPAEGAGCTLVAPCRHSTGATPILAFPPATLSAAAILPAPARHEGAHRPPATAPRPLVSSVPTPPPRSPAA